MFTTIITKTRALLFGFTCSMLSTVPVWAADTEIFFGGTNANSGIRPNVLFILDTSGSMTGTDGTGISRINRMKDALKAILNSVSNINVGLMRFTNPGGPILFPVSYVDENVCNVESCAAPSVTASVSSSTDDAEENSAGVVDLTSKDLEMASDVKHGASSETLREVDVATGNDDAEEDASGTVLLTSSDLEFTYVGGEQVIGLRFQNVAVPQGATIAYAELEFQVDESPKGTVNVDIYGQNADNAAGFTATSNNVSSRNKTVAKVDWDDLPPTDVGGVVRTPDLTALVQEIVNRGGWSTGNSMAFIVNKDPASTSDSNNVRIFESFNGTKAPRLRVYYLTGAGLADKTQTVGLRFGTVQIPQGATITSAYLDFESDKSDTQATNLVIKAEAADNAATYSNTANNLSSRTKTTAAVAWNAVPVWSQPDKFYQSPDVKDLVQEVVNRSGWCGGNAMAFQITGTGRRTATSYDGSTGTAPKLKITYDTSTLTAAQGCVGQTFTKQIAIGSDDAEESSGSGSVNVASSDLQLIKDGANQIVGLRFQSLNIPQGATIQQANVDFVIDVLGTTPNITLNVYGQAHDDAATFTTTKNDVTSRAKTTATVTWAITTVPAVNATLSTPDIKTVIQEIVNRSAWASGNDIVVILAHQSGTGLRVAKSYERSPTSAPKLTVKATWKTTSATQGPTVTVRNRLVELVDGLTASGNTPIVDSLYEGALYFRGEAVDYGKNRGYATSANRRYNRVSHPASYTGGSVYRDASCLDSDLNSTYCATEAITGSPVYKSPITESCQRSYIVLLTDGAPTVNDSEAKIKTMASLGSCAGTGDFACGPEFAKFLYDNDQRTSLADKQNVTTHTVGFNFTGQWLKDIATNGGGSYYEATTAADLSNTFQAIVTSILQIDTSFVSPGAAVNQFNRLTHRDEIYFSLFKPSDRPSWSGNLKRYKVDGNPPVIMDMLNAAAVNEGTGFFKETSKSFWSTAVDGNDVAKGGFAENLNLTSRKVFTYTGTNLSLSDVSNDLVETNTAVTKTLLGITAATDAYRTDLIKWSRGVDVKDYNGNGDITEIRKQVGDPLHSRPVIVTYGGTDANPDTTVFFATNEGYLHAADGETGAEHFAFVPQELLVNLNTFYNNTSSPTRPYGLDGTIAVRVVDNNVNNIIESSNGDFVHLYVGMRRGGRNYYALDVTDRANPKVLWTIKGGSGSFVELAQTWSAPTVGKMQIGNTTYTVLIFAGGYDSDQDAYATRTADTEGRAIYIVNAADGSLLWSAGINTGTFDNKYAAMQYSIPSDIRVLDVNGDGLVDQLWVGDMGGQIWRFDIANGNNTANLVTGGVVFNASSTTAATNRRFYYPPDISLIKKSGSLVLNVAVGSGWREHPLDTVVVDQFYNFQTVDIYNAPASYTTLTASNLYDATANLIGEGSSSDQTTATAQLAAASGWYITLSGVGEKVLAPSITINNQILFTTYLPTGTTSGCQAALGSGRVYLVNVADATPVLNLDQIGSPTSLTKGDRYVSLARGGIPPSPTPFFPDNGASPIVLIGPEKGPAINFGELTGRTYWYEKSY